MSDKNSIPFQLAPPNSRGRKHTLIPSTPPSTTTFSQVTSSRSHGFSNSHIKESDIWKKTLEAHNEHEQFLEKIGQATTTAMKNARFLDSGALPGFALISGSSGSKSRPPPMLQIKESSENIDFGSLDTNKVLQDFYASTKTKTFNSLTKKSATPWRKTLDGHQHQLDIRKNLAFLTFHLTGGEPSRTPPRNSSQEFAPAYPSASKSSTNSTGKVGHSHHHKTNLFPFRGTDDMFDFENSSSLEPRRTFHPPIAYSNISPKIDTGLSQIRKVTKFTASGVPILEKKLHPLTIGPQFTAKSFDYDTYRATRRQERIADVTNRLYNNLGSIKNIRHLYTPLSHRVGTQIKAGMRAKQSEYPFTMGVPSNQMTSFSLANQFGKNRTSPFPYGRVGSGGADLSRNPFQRNISSIYGQNRHSSSYGHNNHSGPHQQRHHNIDPNNTTGGKTYRPSQLLPIHIPGPKYDNIFIGPYSEEMDREKKVGGPMKSRKR